MSESIPCALCTTAPAELRYSMRATTLGVGDVTLYLCSSCYDRLARERAQASAEERRQEAERHTFRRELESAKQLVVQLYRDTWTDREPMWRMHQGDSRRYEQIRDVYRLAAQASPGELAARLAMLRLAALCLASAIGVQELHKGDAIAGTLRQVTANFTKRGLLISGKSSLSQEEVVSALLAILRYRETHVENEEDELALLIKGEL